MITLRRITDIGSSEYRFMEELLVAAFPLEERRDLAAWRTQTAGREIFRNNLICDDDKPIGLISYWELGGFHYVEHFAIAPEFRNGGYGQRVLERLLGDLSTPVVLEVETPSGDMARRRIGFYRRQGFVLWDREYQQPPYRPHGEWLPMCLMVHGDLQETEFSAVRDAIYAQVYER